MNAAPAHFLIVGQGLAGSLLAVKLLDAGQQVTLIDNHHSGSSSMAAAGLINPVTGKRLLQHPDTPLCLPSALAFYQRLEQRFKQPFLHRLTMQRLFLDKTQQQLARQRLDDKEYRTLLGPMTEAADGLAPFRSEYGHLKQHLTGYLDIPALLDTLRREFCRDRQMVEDAFRHEQLIPGREQADYRGQLFDKVIFCEGYQARQNPWFDWLPFQPAKGDILTIRTKAGLGENIINRGTWLLPLGKGRYKTGATSQWQFTDDKPDEAGRKKAEQQFKALFGQTVPAFSVEQHQAGIRPATRDKNAFLGVHPFHPTLVFFNGFGARGSLTIPGYADTLVCHLLQKTPLPAHLDIARYHAPADTDRPANT